MLTPFGKALRQYRIDNGLLLYDMAKACGLSSAQLSSIETGKAPVTVDFVHVVTATYKMNSQEINTLHQAWKETLQMKGNG